MSDDGLFGVAELQQLIRGPLLDGVFDCLDRIWGSEEVMAERNVSTAEYRTKQLERLLSRQNVGLYDELVEAAGNHPLCELSHGCGVVMDALSLREGFRLRRELPAAHNWDVTLDWAGIERLPSETTFVCEEWFNAHSPSAVSRNDYRYIGSTTVPQLPGTDPEFVWTRHPDGILETRLTGNDTDGSLDGVYCEVRELLEGIIAESVHDEFLVTSDHGYVADVSGNPFVMTDEQAEMLRDAVGGRYTQVADEYALDRLSDAEIIRRVGGYYVVAGQYFPTRRGATKRIRHGGLTIPEVMTPVLRIST